MTDQRPRRSKWDTPSVQDAGCSVSSLEAASAAAAKINAMLISKGKLKLPTTQAAVPTPTMVNKMQKQNNALQRDEKSKNEPLLAEVEINEVPIHCRNMLTKGATQDEISRITGAAVSTRGRFMSYADRATNNMGERPLYLCVQGPTKECVDRAVDHIKRLIADGMQPKNKARTHSRFNAPGAQLNSFNRMPPPGVGGPPGPPMGGPLRGPPPIGGGGPLRGPSNIGGIRGPSIGGGMVRNPGLGGPPNPMVPPPAIQMAIQSAQSSGHYLQDKVFVGLEHADPSFMVRDKVQGPGSAFLHHIRAETGANVYLRGRGSGFMEPTSGREAFENLYIYITHPKPEGLAAAKKLCENLVVTIQSEYMTHQSQIFQSQRSAPAMAAAYMIAAPRPALSIQAQPVSVGMMPQAPPTSHPITSMCTTTHLTAAYMIAAPARPALSIQPQPAPVGMMPQPPPTSHPITSMSTSTHLTAAHMIPAPRPPAPSIQPQPVSVGMMPQAPPTVITTMAVPATSQTLSQTLAAQQQAQAILAGQKPTMSTVMVSVPQGVAYPQLHMQTQLAIVSQAGMTLQGRPPQPVPAPAPVPPPQAQQIPLPVASQPQLFFTQAPTAQQAQAGLAELQAQIAGGQVHVQSQPGVQGQVRVQVQAQQHPVGLSVSQQEHVLVQEIQQQQPIKRRFREDLSPDVPEHHQIPMNTLGAAPPGLEPMGVAGGMAGGMPGVVAGGMVGGQTTLLAMQRPPSPDRSLMPPPPMPSSMRDAGRKHLTGGLDVLGRVPSPDEPRLKRGRLVSYEAGGDSDDDIEEAANRARIRFQISSTSNYVPPPRGTSAVSMGLSQPGLSTHSSSSYYKQERRDPGVGSSLGSSPFWMARN